MQTIAIVRENRRIPVYNPPPPTVWPYVPPITNYNPPVYYNPPRYYYGDVSWLSVVCGKTNREKGVSNESIRFTETWGNFNGRPFRD